MILSFVFAGLVAGLTAICYAELASAVPVSGSSYSYAYATLGEGVAIVVAACLLLEYGVSSAAVAVGWSQYLNELFDNLFGFTIPDSFAQAPEQGGVINLPAVILIVLCTLLLIRGASESAKVNAAMVIIKLGVLLLFVVIGLQGWNSDNLSDFAPFGLNGITSAAGIIFFSYIGLDAVSTAGEEVKNPRRTMPLAIIIALITVTTVYIAVAVVAVAAQPVADFKGQEAGLSAILEKVTGSTTPATILAAGAVISIFSVTLVTIYGQTRILFAMGRDGMVPPIFHRVNPRTLTPVPATIIAAVVISLLAGLLPIDFLAEMTSIGTLVAFLIVSIGVIVLRRTAPDLPRGFKVPGYPVTPVLSIAGCIWIIQDLRAVTIIVFFGWSAVALTLVLLLRPEPFRARPRVRGGRSRRHDASWWASPRSSAPRRCCTWRACWRARSTTDAVLCAVVPAPWPPSPAKVDAEYREYLTSAATDALEEARERLSADVPATALVHHARSAPAGLLEVAERHDASLIAVGSSTAGALGQVTLGSVSSSLLHSSPIPVALATRGYRCKPVTGVTTGRRRRSADTDGRGAGGGRRRRGRAVRRVAARRLLRGPARPPYTSGVGREADGRHRRRVARRGSRRPVPEALEQVERPAARAARLEAVVGSGETGRTRSRTSSGTTATCSWSARAAPGRSRGCSSARGRPRSCATRRSRSSSSRAARPRARRGRADGGLGQPRRRSAIPVSVSRATRSATSAE